MHWAAIAFWTLSGALAWTFAGYPLVMFARARGRRPRSMPVPPAPTLRVSVVLAVRDEAPRIPGRLANLLSQAYPAGLLEVLVVCNGCSDGTPAVARRIAAGGARVRVLESPAGAGKTGALNVGVAAATGEIVVFTDARQRFAAAAVHHLVAAFADPLVGAVSGRLVLERPNRPALLGISRYWEWETRLRLAESRTGSVVGATGAIYAVRRELIEPLPTNLILDDVYLPLRVARRGYRVAMVTDAVAYDVPADTEESEYRRKLRTLVGSLQLVRLEPALLSPWQNPLFFRFVSHKVLRVVSPACVVTLLALGLLLSGPIYGTIAAALLSVYVVGVVGLVFRVPLLAMPSAFVLVQAAAIAALMRPNASAHDVWTR